MTSGGEQGTSGARREADLLRHSCAIATLAFCGFGILYMLVNAVSLVDQRQALGLPIAPWQAWVLEGTSFAAWLALLPVVFALGVLLARRPLWLAVLGHAGGCVAVSLIHTLLMVALRIAVYALAEQEYAPAEPWADRLLFEARKDVITYVSILAVFLLARKLVASPQSSSPPRPVEPALIEVRDGSRVVNLRSEEIDWVGAAGNYVELHGAFGSELARRTLADLEKELAPHGFIRIHRSRLVRRAAIEVTETRQSGDFEITLRSGAVIGGSRRFRQNLA